MANLRFRTKFIRESLGSPSAYLWLKCFRELGYSKRLRTLSIQESRYILGWFFLYAQHRKDRSPERCLIAYYACSSVGARAVLVPVMDSQDILKLKDRPSTSTLYRRGFKTGQKYNAEEVERLLRR